MIVKSCYSKNVDPYRAGSQIGKEMAHIQPEVIFLFSGIHYESHSELLEGLYDTLGSDDTILIGNTGDGFYEYNAVGNVGVSALGINGEGKIKWHLSYEPGIEKAPFETTERCIKQVNSLCQSDPAFYFVTSDFRTDSNQLAQALQKHALAPVIGGLAGDEHHFQHCLIFVNRMTLTDTIAMLAVEGDIAFDIRVAQELYPVGRGGVITKREGTIVHTINDTPAMTFLESELGKPLEVIDEGTLVLQLTEKEDVEEHQIRSMFLAKSEEAKDEKIKLFGGLKEGDRVQTCIASPVDIINEVRRIGESTKELSFKPTAGLIVSCAGRKKVLAGNVENEVNDIVQNCRSLKALAGYPSFGEFAPVKNKKGYSRPLFHNMTFVLLLIGESPV